MWKERAIVYRMDRIVRNSSGTRALFDADRLGSEIFMEGGTIPGYAPRVWEKIGKYVGTGVLLMAAACGGGAGPGNGGGGCPPNCPQPQSMSITGKTIHYFDKSPVSENVRVQYAGTTPVTDIETTSGAVDGKYLVTIPDVRGANPNADSTLRTGQPTTGNNTPFYKRTITGLKLGATPNTTVTIPDVIMIPRFVEPGTNVDSWDWYTFETGSGTEVNWTYPINIFLDENNPNAKPSGRDYPSVIKRGLDSWVINCSPDLTNKMFNYVTSKPSKGIDVVYISNPAKPCIRPVKFVAGSNNELTNVTLEVNTICALTVALDNESKHEAGHALGFTAESPYSNDVMNPIVVANPNHVNQSPKECTGRNYLFSLPISFPKSTVSK